MPGRFAPTRIAAMYGSVGCTRAASCASSAIELDAFEVEHQRAPDPAA